MRLNQVVFHRLDQLAHLGQDVLTEPTHRIEKLDATNEVLGIRVEMDEKSDRGFNLAGVLKEPVGHWMGQSNVRSGLFINGRVADGIHDTTKPVTEIDDKGGPLFRRQVDRLVD